MLRDRKPPNTLMLLPHQCSKHSKPSSSQRQHGKRVVLSAMMFCAVAAVLTTVLLLTVLQWRIASETHAAERCAAAAPPAGARIQRLPYIGGSGDASDTYTLLLNSFRRHDLLKASIKHYAQCPQLDTIRVVWSEDKEGPPSAQQDPAYYSTRLHVQYDVQPSASLNSRFQPPPGLRTLAVLSIDDDIVVPCKQVAETFAAWQQNPDQLVGWFPRSHAASLQPAAVSVSGGTVKRSTGEASPDSSGNAASNLLPACSYHYLLRDSAVLLRRSYSIILTKGAFLHRDWLRTYTESMPPSVLSYVDNMRNCEDLAMAFLVANATGQPPVYHRASGLKDLGQGVMKVKGISSLGGHSTKRSACVTEFVRLMHGMPLVSRSLSEHRNSLGLQLSTLWDRAI